MAKYECKVCGYIYNEQHAGRPFEELTECPICNEGKENFFAHGEEGAEQPKAAEPAVDVSEEDDFVFEEIKDDVAEAVVEAEEAVEDVASDVEDIAEAPEFVVERRQDFWSPVGAKPAEKEEAPSNNTTGWTISNARGSVERVLGEEAEEVASDLEDTILEEEDDVPAYASRIESFYSNAEAVGTSHIISGDEEEEPFKPLWNSGGGTVQRVIDPFGDRNDTVVKAENVGMVMPAEEPVAEEPFAFFDDEEEPVANPEAEADVFKAIDSIVFEDDVPEGGRVELVTPDGVEEIPLADDAEEAVEAVEEVFEEVVEETVEEAASEVEEVVVAEDEVVEEAIVEEVADELPALDDDDDFVFEEYTMPASGDVFGEVKEEVVFEDAEDFVEEIVEDVEPVVEVAEEPIEEVMDEVAEAVEEAVAEAPVETAEEMVAEKEDDFVFEGFDEAPVAEEIVAEPVEEITEETVSEEVTEEPAVEIEDTIDEIAEADEDDFAFDEVEETVAEENIAEVSEEDFVADEVVEATDDIVEEMAEEIAEESVEEAVEAEPVAEEKKEADSVIKAWSFLDDVVEAGAVAGGAAAAAGGAVAGVTFVSKAMDEVVEEEVTEDDIEEVFVSFADERKVGVHGYDANASLASELFEAEDSIMDEIFKEAEPVTEEKVSYCNNLEKILIVPAQLNPMPLPEGTKVEGRTVLGIASEKPLVLDDPVFSTGEYNMVQYIPNSGLTSEDYQKADAIEIIVGHGNGIEKTINSKEDLRQVVNFLRLESDGCPIGIKMAASRIERDLEFCVFAKPDYVVLNNFDVVPLPYALHRATKFLNTVQSGMDIVIALDGAKDAEELAKIMAMGADVIALRNRPDDMIKMTEGLKKYARITGHYDVEDLNVKDLCTTDREIAEYTDIYHV